jgi:hypothetical protein
MSTTPRQPYTPESNRRILAPMIFTAMRRHDQRVLDALLQLWRTWSRRAGTR